MEQLQVGIRGALPGETRIRIRERFSATYSVQHVHI